MDFGRLRDFLHEYILTSEQLQEVYHRFGSEIEKGLSKSKHAEADTKCYITYVQDLPSGEEKGKYLALDLGGTNFRVLLITLKGNHEAQIDSKIYTIPQKVMLGPGKQLFDLIATCLWEFVSELKMAEEHLPLAFTFSFPCTQLGLSRAKLVRWTKGFNCTGVVDQDIVQLLKEAIDRKGNLHIEIMAILNDTTGTLMSCAHRNSQCRIGLIVGTGSNACYVERVENCENLAVEYKDKTHMVINIEWGAFGEHGGLEFIRTDFDRLLDFNSINKGTQLFEKMLSGMYLGELVRLLFSQAVRENLIFTDCCVRSKLAFILSKKIGIIETRHLAEIEGDDSPQCTLIKKVLRELFCLENPPILDCQKLKFICEAISRRSGNLIGVALSFLMNKMFETRIVVGVDGSVYKFHPKFDEYMREGIRKFLKPEISFNLMLSEDGSGRGAALVAAVVAENQSNK